jgi:glutathione S-transferase
MLELFYSPGACSLASHIALHEAGARFELRRFAIAEGKHKSEEYLAINPRARIPALRDGDWVLVENPAILTYIARRFPQSGLLPRDERHAASCESLLAYFSSSVHIAFAQFFRPDRFIDDIDIFPKIKAKALTALREHFAHINDLLKNEWMLECGFSLADLYPLIFYRWAVRIGIDTSSYENWSRHVARMLARPAVRRAMEQEQIEMGPVGC